MQNYPLLGPIGTLFVAGYLLSLIGIGWAGKRARREESLADFYLGGRNMGFLVLFLTLYATQYSGNTLIGYAGAAYRQGFRFLVSVTFMMSIVGAYLLFAPKLYRLSRERSYITLGDFLQDRYGSRSLTLITTVICIFALGSYILANLKAMGYLVVGATGGRVSFIEGIVALSLIMVVYETLGGLRSVAWTDVIQGILLLAGCISIFVVIHIDYGGLAMAAETLGRLRPEIWSPPEGDAIRAWLSTLAIIFLGVPIYPQAIQRIYAARSAQTLKRSLQCMVFLPLFTTFFVVVVGLVGAARFPGLDRQGSETIIFTMLADIAGRIPIMHLLIVAFLAAVTAAIMSTVDSALLAISSLFTQDIYRPLRPKESQARLTAVGKRFSWLLMAIMAILAARMPQTLWRLTEIKLEVLCQIAPALFLGIHGQWVRSGPLIVGLLVGSGVTFIVMGSDSLGLPIPSKPLGFHAGIWGLAANLAAFGVASEWRKSA